MSIKILFVCLGNICRSPMAEYVMKDLVKKSGLDAQIQISSAATSDYNTGCGVYYLAEQKLAEHEISCRGHSARQLTRRDYNDYDLIIGMDDYNLQDMRWIFNNDPDRKLHLLMDYTDRPSPVADPYYTRDFDATWDDVLEGCQGLLNHLLKKGS